MFRAESSGAAMPTGTMKNLSSLSPAGFDVVIDDDAEKQVFTLNRSYYGLYVPNGLWRELENFSTNSLALILASTPYDVNDYIRDYAEFKTFRHAKQHGL